MKALLIGLILGLGLGLPGGWYALQRYGPKLGLDGREVQGVVDDRRVESDRLQLMLRTESGESILATFRERASDVAALAHVGDSVTLRLGQDGPIADDPHVVRVQPSAEGNPSRFADADTGEEKAADAPEEGEGKKSGKSRSKRPAAEAEDAAPKSEAKPGSTAEPEAAAAPDDQS